jgi:hypothetical protein
MTWWLLPLIIGVVIAGIAFGIVVSFAILKIRKHNLPFTSILPFKNLLHGGNGHQPVAELTATYSTVSPPPRVSGTTDQPQTDYVNHSTVPAPTKIAVNKPVSDILTELENNLAIASRPESAQLLNFKTDMWNTRRVEFNNLGQEIMKELTEAYVDMLLATILSGVTELKRDSIDLSNSYLG